VFIRPDVALAFKQAWATDATGELLDPDVAMVATYVMVKHDERWWIVSRANTLVGT
jgi:ketosteroid isomerase-like protein